MFPDTVVCALAETAAEALDSAIQSMGAANDTAMEDVIRVQGFNDEDTASF